MQPIARHGKVRLMAIARSNLGLSVLLVCAAGSLAGPLRAGDDINWLGSYNEALRVARETQKPLLVEFRCEA